MMNNGDFSSSMEKRGLSEKTKNIVTFSILGGLLVALILIYALLVVPLLYKDQADKEPPEVFDGEATNGTTISLYSGISDKNLIEITVKNDKDEYTFKQNTDENGKISMVIKNHEKVTYDAAVYAYLSVFAKEPRVPLGGTIVRNLTDEQMASYGTTKDLAKAQVSVKYLENGEEKTHSLLIGNKVISSTNCYYVALEGRGSVYSINASFIENSVFKRLTDYITPYIYTKFSSASEAGISIENLAILLTTQTGGSAKEVLLLEQVKDDMTETSASFKFTFPEVYPQKIIASNDYVLSVLNKLYVSFIGDEVVALNPDQATCEKYGLGKDQEQYMIYGSLKDKDDTNTLPAIFISKEFIEGEGDNAKGYYYVLSGFYAEPTIVKLPANELAFLRDDEQTRLDWSATNSVFAGFSQYLMPNADLGAPGVKVMRIRTNDYNETFLISIDARGQLVAKTNDGRIVFETDPKGESYNRNQFNNLYSLLIYYPMPSRFTTVKKSEMADIKVDSNIIYELEVEMNDGKLYKYTYYTLDGGYAGYALCESSEGRVAEDGSYNYTGTPQTIFDVKSRQIGAIAEAYKTIMEGGKINPLDYIY